MDDTFDNTTSDRIPIPLRVGDLEDDRVRQPNVKPRANPLRLSETEHRPWISAQKIALSEVDETQHRQSLQPNEGSIITGYERRRRFFAFAVIAAFALVVIVGLILQNGDGQNSSAGGTQGRGNSWEKRLYYDMAVAEDRGDLEALKRSGGCARDTWNMDVAMYTSLSKQLMASYGDQVLAKYGVSRAQWSEIMWQGATQRWPTPDPPIC